LRTTLKKVVGKQFQWTIVIVSGSIADRRVRREQELSNARYGGRMVDIGGKVGKEDRRKCEVEVLRAGKSEERTYSVAPSKPSFQAIVN